MKIRSRLLTTAAAVGTLATLCGGSLAQPTVASAACNPKTKVVLFNLPEHKTANFEKEADGCSQPWLSLIERTAHIEMWVRFGGAWHKIQTTRCEAGEHTCNLASNWGTACEGGSCNFHEFHLQWEEGEAGEMIAELHY